MSAPPILKESGHSSGLAGSPASFFILVDSGIYTRMFPGMLFPKMGRNGIPLKSVYLLLFICDR